MCDLCTLITDDLDGGLFITSLPPCPKGQALAAAHNVETIRLPLPIIPSHPEQTLWALLACLGLDEILL